MSRWRRSGSPRSSVGVSTGEPFRYSRAGHALELVHRVRRAQASPRGRARPLWPIIHQVWARSCAPPASKGSQACPRGLRHSYGVAAVPVGATQLDFALLLLCNTTDRDTGPAHCVPPTSGKPSPTYWADIVRGRRIALIHIERIDAEFHASLPSLGLNDFCRWLRHRWSKSTITSLVTPLTPLSILVVIHRSQIPKWYSTPCRTRA